MAGQFSERQSEPGAQPKTIVIGTAGHIDHGKTALIRALTGVDTDRLPEEKRRGITIDLGFASLSLPAADGSTVQLSFIDVPGHARFVRNMLAGAGGIDAVLLVISAEEGVKPQTEEHLAICALLGIQCGVTVLTKTDAVDEATLSDVRNSVETFLRTTFLAAEPLVCASAFTGAGLDALREELGLLAARIPVRKSGSMARLPLDRAFTMKGFGTVVTGTLMTGSVAAGQELAVEPGGKTVKIRGIQVHGQSAIKAEAATRAALNLTRMEAAEFHRGDTLVETSTIVAVDTIDAEIRMLADAPALKHRARVHFHAFASECMATISLYGYRPVEPNTSRLARLKLAKPVVLLPGDRFVLRQGAPIATVGGGLVLDAHPVPQQRKARTQEWLRQLLHAGADEQLALRAARRGEAGIMVAELSAETGLTGDAIATILQPTIRDQLIHRLGADLLLGREALLDAVATVHAEFEKMIARAGKSGVKRSSLGSQVRLRPEVLDWALRTLERAGKLTILNDLLLPPKSETAETHHEQEKLSAVLRAYALAGLASPAPSELAAELKMDAAQMRQAITALLREKKLVRLGDDSLCVDQSALADLKQRVQLLRGKTLDVGQFKLLAGVSRKYAIPLLEYLDRERVTRKQGDHRVVL
ncbi:MAG TPA: selenocysteine-specific translation elongation factor [Terracidiphilus sp.]|jgi:selenocysteine-specific elongation factor|nr:selenocysteine-specific translation elongation factor [Terracidiphilus sp.]